MSSYIEVTNLQKTCLKNHEAQIHGKYAPNTVKKQEVPVVI